MDCRLTITPVIAGKSLTGRVCSAVGAFCFGFPGAKRRIEPARTRPFLAIVPSARILVDPAIGIAQTFATGPDFRLTMVTSRCFVAGVDGAPILIIAGLVSASDTRTGITLIVLRACLAVFA